MGLNGSNNEVIGVQMDRAGIKYSGLKPESLSLATPLSLTHSSSSPDLSSFRSAVSEACFNFPLSQLWSLFSLSKQAIKQLQ